MKKSRANRDILGIKPYVDAIVDAIDNFFKDKESKREISFNILISAQWGMGKTFILKRIAKKLKSKGFRTFIFNPWKYSQSPMAIKRKFLQNLHKEFGGRVNLDSLYEGIEGEKQRNLISEATFIASGLFRMLIYSSIISLAIFWLLKLIAAKFPGPFKDFFFILSYFLKIETELKAQNYLLEIAIVVGLLGALVPAIKFVFENISIKIKRAKVDSLEQFEEIFSKIILQKRHPFILGFWNFVSKLFNWVWREIFLLVWDMLLMIWKVLMWDVFSIPHVDKWRQRLYKQIAEQVRRFKTQLDEKMLEFIENHSFYKSTKNALGLFTKRFKKEVIDTISVFSKKNKYPKVAILIDDLDRCEEGEVKNILDGFLTFFEKENCAYIVTADHTVIEEHIAEQLKLDKEKKVSSQRFYSTPKEYLHKIFNLNFLVPFPPKNNLQSFLDETAKSFKLTDNKQIESLAYRFFNRNPRAIRRFYTKIKFSQDVAKNLIKDPEAEEERKQVAQRVLDKPELKAKIIALEMVTPNFFSLITEDNQIFVDAEATRQVNRTKLYFEKTKNIDERLQKEEKNEIDKAERILKSEPYIVNEDIVPEELISFSSSIHSTREDTFDWPQIQQDMEKGNPVFQKIYSGTTNRGREIKRRKALERYKELKAENNENRHLFFQGLVEMAQASYRKSDSAVVEWGTEILSELGSELEEYIPKIESKDYAKLLEIFQDDPAKEKDALLKLLSTDPFRKPSINPNIFQVSDIEATRDEDGKLSSIANATIKHTSEAFKTTLDAQVDPSYQEVLVEIFIANYQAEEQSIPQNHRINYLNSLINLLAQKQDAEGLKRSLDFVKQQTDKALLAGIAQKSWGLIMSTLSDDDLINYLSDPELTSPPTRINILKGIADQVSNWDITKTLKLLEHLKSILTSLPQSKEQLNEEQAPVLDIFLASISTQQAQKSTNIREFISEVVPSFSVLLAEEEKNKIVSIYQTSVDATENLSQLQETRDEAEKAGFSDVAKAANQKIKSIKKKQAKKKSRKVRSKKKIRKG